MSAYVCPHTAQYQQPFAVILNFCWDVTARGGSEVGVAVVVVGGTWEMSHGARHVLLSRRAIPGCPIGYLRMCLCARAPPTYRQEPLRDDQPP